MIKRVIPHSIKINLRILKNTIRDFNRGYRFSKTDHKPFKESFSTAHSITQDLKSNEFKKQNISLAKSLIEPVTIFPQEVFSFWKAVGKPSEKRGFVKSRSLINGEILDSIGGGLCQLSGLIYLVSLHCGIEIIERHNHSTDIYNDNTRYMPLGGDATVAYAYKDLKIKNNFKKPIRFKISLEGDSITVALQHPDPLKINDIKFVIHKNQNDIVETSTLINGNPKVTSTYKKRLNS